MANYERVIIKCEDKGVMKEIKTMYQEESYSAAKESGNMICIRNREGFTDKQLLKLSREHQSVVMFAVYSLQSDRYNRAYTRTYWNGNSILIDIKIQYTYSGMGKIIESIGIEFKGKIINALEKLYKRMDTVTKNALGKIDIEDNNDKEIIVILEIENYKIKASKIGSEIDIQEVEKLQEGEDLEEKTEYEISEDMINLPF